MTAIVSTLVFSATATGCLSQVLPEPMPPPVTYDFGPPPDAPPVPLPARVRLDAVTAPSWLRSSNIYYRRLELEPDALLPYARNRWIASAAELFAERLSHRVALASPEDAAEELAVALELVSFEHVYTGPDRAYVVARARATYDDFDGATHERSFETRRPAAPSVDGATAELPRAADALLDDVLAWLREAAASPRLP